MESPTHRGRATLGSGVPGESGRDAGRPPLRRPIQRAAGRARPRKESGLAGRLLALSGGLPIQCLGRQWPRLALRGLLPFHFFSLFFNLLQTEAETLHSLAAAPESVLFKGQAANARVAGDPGETDTPTRTPKGSLLSTTEPQEPPPPKADWLPWDPTLTKEKLLETTGVPDQLCTPPASQAPHPCPFPLGGGIASHLPQSPALSPSLHPLPRVAWGTFLLFSSWPQSLPHPTTPSLQSLLSNHLACFTWLIA